MKNFVINYNGKFFLNNKQFFFIGSNVYELANLNSLITKKIIQDAYNFGFTVLRFWLFQNNTISNQISKLHQICDVVKPLNIKLIVSLADKWGYLQNYKIDESWYKHDYNYQYLNYVVNIINEFKDRDEIMIWELINEPVSNKFQNFYQFVKKVSNIVKSIDQNHMISIGTVGGIGDKFGSHFSILKKTNFKKIFSLDTIDAISLHDYSYDSGIFERLEVFNRFCGNLKLADILSSINNFIDIPFRFFDRYYLNKNKLVEFPLTLRWLWNLFNNRDIQFAKSVNKPIYIGEIGIKNYPFRNRSKIYDLIIMEKINQGINGILLWSFEAQQWNKDGHNYGFNFNEGIENVVKKWNNMFTK